MGPLTHKTVTSGLHALPIEDYHADPCPEPSLSYSTAKRLLTMSPFHAWFHHPRLNPECPRDESSRRLDLGTIAHALLIGQGRTIEPIDAADYRGKAAQEQRDRARAAGRTPVLLPDLDKALAMADAARRQLAMIAGCAHLFDPARGDGEATIVWQEDSRDDQVWCRARLDWLPQDLETFVDYKTTIGCAHPDGLGRRLADMSYEVQAAFYELAVCSLDPDLRGRVRPIFVFQEVDPPYGLSAVMLDEAALTIGRRKVERAIATWAACLKTNTWPWYPTIVTPVSLPAYAIGQWEEREARAYLETHGGYDPFSMLRPGVPGGARLE